jgi:hypothetical protein
MKMKSQKPRRFEGGGEVDDEPFYAADADDEYAGEVIARRDESSAKPKAKPAAKRVRRPAAKSAPKPAPKAAEAVRRPGMPTHIGGRPYNPPKPIPGYESPLSRLDRTRREEDREQRLNIARDESPARPPTFMGLRGQGMAKGGTVSASRRADGAAQRGKTRGKVI